MMRYSQNSNYMKAAKHVIESGMHSNMERADEKISS